MFALKHMLKLKGRKLFTIIAQKVCDKLLISQKSHSTTNTNWAPYPVISFNDHAKIIRTLRMKGAQWLNAKVLDLKSKSRWFEPHLRNCVVPLTKTLRNQGKSLGKTENLLTGA